VRITVKLGGSILEEAATRMRLLDQLAKIATAGNEIILVHGGGKSMNRRLAQMQMTSHFIDGLRVTDAETLGVAVMVLAGEVNKTIVAEMSGLGSKALGICGADAGAVRCVRVEGLPGYPAGIGFVGKPVDVNSDFFNMLFEFGLVPVVSSIGLGPDSKLYNVNADQMASACASGTSCSSLIYLTDVPGIRDENGKVVGDIDEAGIMDMRARGILSGGMLPKTSSCIEALKAGVDSVLILPGISPNILLKFTDGTLKEGTKIHGND
jgi:acetylglutamate kinase